MTDTSATSPTAPAAEPSEVVAALVGALGDDAVLVDADRRTPYETDWTGAFHGRALAVVRPSTVEQVAAVVAVCRAAHLGLVPQGGNTGLVGGGVPRNGDVVLDLRRFDTIEAVDVTARQVTVGAGVRLADLQRAAGVHGLRYAIDFAARDTATVGGSIATNAGGINFLRFGGTRQQVVGVEAVLGSGLVVRRLAGIEKDNTGYDLAGLLCGSEGTLGIVTRARLRLVPLARHRVTALVGVDSVDAAVAALAAVRAEVAELEAAELMLGPGVDLVGRSFDWPSPLEQQWPAYVLFEAAADHDPSDALARAIDRCSEVGEVAVAGADDAAARRALLWRHREHHSLALRNLGPVVKLDVTVPLAVLAEFVDSLDATLRTVDPAVKLSVFGHLGDGNLHVNLTGHRADDPHAVHDLERAVLGAVVAHGGCISAEHGIGRLKAPWLGLDRSADEIAAMRAVKAALDPDGVMNPGVLFPSTNEEPS